MGGIAGLVFRDVRQHADELLLRRMAARMGYRGRDEAGYHVAEGAGLTARHLSGHGVHGERNDAATSSIHVVLDGDIYNHEELRGELLGRGHALSAGSDTELVAALYCELGLDCVGELRGAFALAIWDGRRRRCLLARDPLGAKPLNYALLSDRLVFATELASLLAHPGIDGEFDPVAIDRLLTFGYLPGTNSVVRGARRLPPGHRIVWEGPRSRLEPFAASTVAAPGDRAEESAWAAGTRRAFVESVALRVPDHGTFGAVIDGGRAGAALLAALAELRAQPTRTFSVSLGRADRAGEDAAIAQADPSHRQVVVGPDVAASLDDMIAASDEPLARPEALVCWTLVRAAKPSVDALLVTDGAADVLGSRDAAGLASMAAVLERLPGSAVGQLRRWLDGVGVPSNGEGTAARLLRAAEGLDHPAALGPLRWSPILGASDRERLYGGDFLDAIGSERGYEPLLAAVAEAPSLDDALTALWTVARVQLPAATLLEADAVGAACGVDVRLPFVDEGLLAMAAAAPPGQPGSGLARVFGGEAGVAADRGTAAVEATEAWLRGPLQDLVRETLSPARLRRRDWFCGSTVETWLSEYYDGKPRRSRLLWTLLVFELWADAHLGKG